MMQPINHHSNINPHVSVDCVIFGFDFSELNVLLIERKKGDFCPPAETLATAEQPTFALPGDHIREDEKLDQAAARVLKELTNLEDIYLEQFHAFGDPNRASQRDREWMRSIRADSNARVITVAYYSLVRLDMYKPSASSFARTAEWIPISQIPSLAFDHNRIINKALQYLRQKLKNEAIGFELLPSKFTLSQLQKLYEIILGTELEKRNFRRKILKKDFLIGLNEKQKNVPHKAARMYSFDRKRYEELKRQADELDIGFAF